MARYMVQVSTVQYMFAEIEVDAASHSEALERAVRTAKSPNYDVDWEPGEINYDLVEADECEEVKD